MNNEHNLSWWGHWQRRSTLGLPFWWVSWMELSYYRRCHCCHFLRWFGEILPQNRPPLRRAGRNNVISMYSEREPLERTLESEKTPCAADKLPKVQLIRHCLPAPFTKLTFWYHHVLHKKILVSSVFRYHSYYGGMKCTRLSLSSKWGPEIYKLSGPIKVIVTYNLHLFSRGGFWYSSIDCKM